MWKYLLIFAVFCFLLYASVSLRIALSHPLKTILFAVSDTYDYFIHKRYNLYKGGEHDCYVAHFGRGKTLSAVHRISQIYQKYNNKPIWDDDQKIFIKQYVVVLSNITFSTIPCEFLSSMSQIVDITNKYAAVDKKLNIRTVVLVLIDESSSLLNSRSFKDNLSPEVLRSLLSMRHAKMSLFETSQKFLLEDKLLREVTQRVIECKKVWRFQVQYIFDADQVELASSTDLLKPLYRSGWFITPAAFSEYDTLNMVQDLKKRIDQNDFLSEDEILAKRGDQILADESLNLNKKAKKRFHK